MLVDIQNSPDLREVELEQVGVRDLRYPITVMDRENERQDTVANLSLSVALPQHFKGTHMSRFIEILHANRGHFTMKTLPSILDSLRNRLDAERARIEVTFPYFVSRVAPASKEAALLDYQCSFIAESTEKQFDFVMKVEVPVTSLCPCSKAISDYGAHNQRGYVTIELKPVKDVSGHPSMIWIEELVEVAESSASAPIYPLLKRIDERHVTMQAYDNPVFVEDIVRNVAVKLRQDSRVQSFVVEAVNQESIHNHSAYARTTWERQTSSVEAKCEEFVGV